MTNLLEKFNEQQIQRLAKEMPAFCPGNDLKVTFKVVDSMGERIQIFEGVCMYIKKKSWITLFFFS